jgi:hypothetical protein
MKTTFALAACAALSLAVASCGDDDDDDASGDTTAVTVADSDETSPSSADTASAGTAADDAADATSADTGSAAGDTAPAIEISDEQAADCAAFEELNESLPDVDPPAVDEEISDEYKDEARSAIEQLEELDLQSDEAQAARDSLVDDINQLVDADTMTEELQALGASEELIAFGEICAAGAAG